MATGGTDKDDMDSLFEGMVLFTPSQMLDNHDANSHSDHAVRGEDAATGSSSLPSSEPLDENLFSDLTVIMPSTVDVAGSQMAPDPSPSIVTSTMKIEKEATPSSSISRQPSRRKKRASVRIGYGRDVQLADEPLPFSSPPSLSIERSLSSATTTVQSDLDAEGDEGEEKVDSSKSDQVNSNFMVPKSDIIDKNANDKLKSSDLRRDEDHGLNLTCRGNVESPMVEVKEDYTLQDRENEEANIRSDSFEAKYERIKAQVSEKLRHAQELASSVSKARKECRRKRRKAAENVELASVRYREIEKELEEACEAEDFERADSLSESLASAEKERKLLLNVLRDAEAACDSIDLKMQEVLEFQIAAEEECVSLLQRFSEDAVNNADCILENAKVSSSKETDEWFSSIEALEVKKMEIETEAYLVDDARSTLSNSIEHLVENDIIEKEQLLEEKKSLTDELERLLSLVRQKEAEISGNDAKIEAVDKRISEVVSGFDDVQSGINAKFDNLNSILSQMESEREALSKKKKEIDDVLFREKDKGVELRKLAMASADEAKAYHENVGLRKILMRSVLKDREEKVGLARTEDKIVAEIQTLQHEIAAARSSLQELSSKKSNFLQEIASTKQRISFIDKRVPELESEKKVAAAARNFKEAARIASEAKTLSAEKDDLQSKIEDAMLRLTEVEKNMNETSQKVDEFEELVSLKEKEAALARYQRLNLIAGEAMAEHLAALELGDNEEAKTLLAEAKASESEAKELQELHHIRSEEIENLPARFIPVEFLSSLDRAKLAELTASETSK